MRLFNGPITVTLAPSISNCFCPFLAATRPLMGMLPSRPSVRRSDAKAIPCGMLSITSWPWSSGTRGKSSLNKDAGSTLATSAGNPAGFGPTSLSKELNQNRSNCTAAGFAGLAEISVLVSF